MDDNKLRFGVGVLVISAIGLGTILTFLFGAFPSLLTREYTLNVEFPSAEGVSTNTPVLRDGVKIGRVANIELLPKGGVLLTLSMDEGQQLAHTYIPRISMGSLITGDAKLEFVRADPRTLASIYEDDPDILSQPYGDGDYLNYGRKAEDPFNVLFSLEDDMRSTMESIRDAGQTIQQAGDSVNQLAGEIRTVVGGSDIVLEDVSDEAVEALRQFQGTMQDVREIINNPVLRQNLEASAQRLPELLDEAATTLESTQQTFESFERVGDRFERVGEAAERTIGRVEETANNVARFTAPLGDRGGELVEQTLRTLANLDRTLLQVETFGEALNQSDGTLARLLEDDELYWEIRGAIENIEAASVKIRPILDDVRVFTDKIARDPRQLGIRGALTHRPNGAGLK